MGSGEQVALLGAGPRQVKSRTVGKSARGLRRRLRPRKRWPGIPHGFQGQ